MRKPAYFNRELSWLEFNARVLEEALDPGNPLLERLKFLAIVGSNFDEFFMVRVASLKAALRSGEAFPDPSGLGAGEILDAIARRTRDIVARQYDCLLREVLPGLEAEGLAIARPSRWTGSERRWLESWFAANLEPVVTPLRVTEGEGFPATGNLRIHAAFSLRGDSDGSPSLAIVQAPPGIDRFVRLPTDGPGIRVALLDDALASFGHRLFPGYTVIERLLFKVTRDADLGVDEDREEDFIAAMEEALAGRQNSWATRLTVSADSEALAERVRDLLGLEERDVYAMPGPIDLRSFMELAAADGPAGPAGDRLRFPPWPQVRSLEVPEGSSLWEEIRKGDQLLHVPYESFDPVVRFVEAAADDPAVLALKMTLYRTSGNSPIVRALTRAARSGKQVAVIVELKARFDEERNMAWASRLEQAGAIVVYGAARLKVHAKAALVVRREDDGSIRRYLHLSTGNYNDRTARLYADLSLFTSREELCREASAFFNAVTGYSAIQELRLLAVAPFDLKARLLSLIRREAQRSSAESPGLVMAKMNALVDTDIIDALYAASQAGVRVMLNVRGICALVPGVKGLSENVQVVSVVGRYLEHARAFYFRNGGAEELFLSSADWMPRNLEKRVELLFPLLDEGLRKRVHDILLAYFADNTRSHRLGPSGRWKRVEPAPGEAPFSAQESFYEAARLRRALEDEPAGRELQVRRRPS